MLESVFIEVIDKTGSFYVGAVYRPPGSNLDVFNGKIKEVLAKLPTP